jgi:hypothetical protein
MTKSFRNRAAGVAAVAVMLLQSILLSASSRATTEAPIDLNFGAEIQALESFDDALTSFEKTCQDLGKKATLTSQEFRSGSQDRLRMKGIGRIWRMFCCTSA